MAALGCGPSYQELLKNQNWLLAAKRRCWHEWCVPLLFVLRVWRVPLFGVCIKSLSKNAEYRITFTQSARKHRDGYQSSYSSYDSANSACQAGTHCVPGVLPLLLHLLEVRLCASRIRTHSKCRARASQC